MKKRYKNEKKSESDWQSGLMEQAHIAQRNSILKIDTGLKVQIQSPVATQHSNHTIHENSITLELHKSDDMICVLQYPEINDCGAHLRFDICIASADIHVTELSIKKELSIILTILEKEVSPQVFAQDGSKPTDRMILANVRNWCTFSFKDLPPATTIEIIVENQSQAAKELIEVLQTDYINTNPGQDKLYCQDLGDAMVVCDMNASNQNSDQASVDFGSMLMSDDCGESIKSYGICTSDTLITPDLCSQTSYYPPNRNDVLASMIGASTESPVKEQQVWCDFTSTGSKRPPRHTPSINGRPYSRAKGTKHIRPDGRGRASDKVPPHKKARGVFPSAKRASDTLYQWQSFARHSELSVKDHIFTEAGRNMLIEDYHKQVKDAWSDKAKETRYKLSTTSNMIQSRTNSAVNRTPQYGLGIAAHSEHLKNTSSWMTGPYPAGFAHCDQLIDTEIPQEDVECVIGGSDPLGPKRSTRHDDIRIETRGGAKFRPILKPIDPRGGLY